MSSKRRLRRKRCTNKKRYPDQESAGRALHFLKVKKGRDLGLYGCGNCGGFHLGHVPQFVKDKIEEKRVNREHRDHQA